MIKLIAVDMDGTFLTTQKTYDHARFAKIFAQLTARKIKFVVASGNQFAQLASFFPAYPELTYVAENGALIFDQGKLIHENHFDPQTVCELIQFLRQEHPNVNMVLNGLKGAYLEKSAPEEFKKIVYFYCHALELVDDLLETAAGAEKYVRFALGVPEEKTEVIAKEISGEFAGKAAAVSSGHGNVDIILPNKHKANALQVLAARWQIKPEEIMAFGDGHNDLEMLRYAGHSYAMANGAPAVKAAARYQAPSNDHHGVLDVIERYLQSAGSCNDN